MAGSVKPWGYRTGGIQQVEFKVADAATGGIAVGDFVIMESGNAGYIVKCSAGDAPIGVAMSACSAPSADGAQSVKVNIAADAIYEYPPDAGTVTQALVGTTMDTGGAQSINIDASTDDVIIVVGVDIERNSLLVKLTPTFLGVA
jgi:hypothetical protein